MLNSPFGGAFKPVVNIPEDCEVVFVADMFKEDYVGGAELTTEALIEASPFKVFKIHSKDVTLTNLEQGHEKYWVFGNFANLNKESSTTALPHPWALHLGKCRKNTLVLLCFPVTFSNCITE